MAKKLSKKAIERLRIVQKQILRSPGFYDQEVYAHVTRCGTVCCIAGWLHYNEVGAKEHLKAAKDGVFDFRRFAAKLLGVDYYYSRLFSAAQYYWPEPFAMDYAKAKTPRERAQVASRMIDHFIEVDGAEE